MNKPVNPAVAALILIVVGALLFGAYRYVQTTTDKANLASQAHPGASEIPPKKPGDDRPAPPPAGMRVPGVAPR